MFGIRDITIDFLTSSPGLVILSLIVGLALTVYLYYRTNPPLPLYLRIALGMLRGLAVLCLFAALMQPVVSLHREYVRQKRVSVILDHSRSMDRVEMGKSRATRLDSVLSGESYAALRANADVTPYYFGGNLSEESDAVDQQKTALGDALGHLELVQMDAPADQWILFSDGRANAGKDPIREAQRISTPIVGVYMAGQDSSYDIGVDQVNFSPISFVDRPSEVTVRLKTKGARGRNIEVQLAESAAILDRQRVSIDQDDGLAEVTLTFTPTSPGEKILRVDIPALTGEETADNNRRSFSIKVLKSRLSILMVTVHPDHEVGFLRRFLLSSDKYDVDVIATGAKAGNLAGQFPSRQSELNKYDLVILHDPDLRSLESRQDVISSYLSEKGGALWLIMGETFASAGPVDWFNRLLPFSQSRQRRIEIFTFRGVPSEEQLLHPAIRLADTQGEIREIWSDLPPFSTLVVCDQINPDGVVLASCNRSLSDLADVPILGYRRLGPGKLLASAAAPFWSWGFLSLGYGEEDQSYARFVEGSVSWLTVRDDFEPVRVAPQKEVYSRGEPTRFEGFAYDLGFRPISGAVGEVRLRLVDGGAEIEMELQPSGDGQYAASFGSLAPGRYRWQATMHKEGNLLSEDEGIILIESFSLEEFDQSGDRTTMAAISRASGGNDYTFADFDLAVQSLDLKPVAVKSRQDITVWNRHLLLLIFIGLLAVEWVIRKAYQLI